MAGLVGQTLDHYRLVEQLGQGGMATVYRAQDLRRGEDVAIKVLSPTITGEKRFVKRFRREAEIVKQRLKHPNIVPVIAYGETKGYVYIVMPYIRGETLSDRLLRKGLTENEATQWVGEICDALQFAHKKSIIHRDIKPANIMLKDSGEAVLMDFGLARHVEGSGKLTGSMLMGTPAFVSPEQAQGKKLDARSDQYSFGVVLYLISTGHLPFDSESPMALVLMHIQDPVPRPSRFNPALKPPLERVILKSLAKVREERFKNIAELKRAYQSALAGDPLPWVEAPTQSLPEKAAISVAEGPRRRPFPAWVVPASAVPVVALLAIVAFNNADTNSNGDTGSGLPGTPINAQGSPSPPTEELPTETPAPTLVPTPVKSSNCPGLSMSALAPQGNQVGWSIENFSGSEVMINNIGFRFLDTNKPQEVRLGGDVWLDEAAMKELLEDSAAELSPHENMFIANDTVRSIRIKHTFGPPAERVNQLEVHFEAGDGQCSLLADY